MLQITNFLQDQLDQYWMLVRFVCFAVIAGAFYMMSIKLPSRNWHFSVPWLLTSVMCFFTSLRFTYEKMTSLILGKLFLVSAALSMGLAAYYIIKRIPEKLSRFKWTVPTFVGSVIFWAALAVSVVLLSARGQAYLFTKPDPNLQKSIDTVTMYSRAVLDQARINYKNIRSDSLNQIYRTEMLESLVETIPPMRQELIAIRLQLVRLQSDYQRQILWQRQQMQRRDYGYYGPYSMEAGYARQ